MKVLKAFFSIFIICAAIAASVSCGETTDDVPKGMQAVESDFVDYKFYVPETWTVDVTQGYVSAYNPEDKSNVSVITMTSTNAYASFEEYIDEYVGSLADTFSNFEYIESESLIPTADRPETGVTLGGSTAARIVYTIKVGDATYKYMQVVTAVGYYIYTLTYTALTSHYDAHLDEVYQMIKEFKF